MFGSREAPESVAERARRALQDNDGTKVSPGEPFPPHSSLEEREMADPLPTDESEQPQPSSCAPPPQGLAAWPAASGEQRLDAEIVARRVQAIQLTRSLEPRLRCSRKLVQELSRRLGQTATDSVHYEGLLRRMREAHGELRWLEGQMEEAQHVIRSTEWLMEMLADPLPLWRELQG